MASQLFPLAAQADDKLSRVVSELQALVQVRDEESINELIEVELS
jgi:hypothetical protein